MASTKPTCRAADRARLGPQRSCSKKISALAMGLERLRHDADVGDTRLLDRVHDRGECAEGDVFVGAEINRLMRRVANLLLQHRSNGVDVDRIVAQENPLLLVDADDQALLGDLLNGSRLGDVDFNARLQYRRRDHENDQQNQDDVDKRGYVDIGESDLRPAIRCGEGHYRRTSSGMRDATGWRSTAFSISREKSSARAAKSRIDPPIRL